MMLQESREGQKNKTITSTTKSILTHKIQTYIKQKKINTRKRIKESIKINGNVWKKDGTRSTYEKKNNKRYHEENYTQYDPSLSSTIRYPLSDYVPKQSPTPQQTCILIQIVSTTYSVDSRKIPRSTNVSKTLSGFYSRTPRPPA